MSLHHTLLLSGAVLALPCLAQPPDAKATIVLVGDADKFNIGQEGYCGNRNEVNLRDVKQFRIPANKETFFYIQARIHGAVAVYTCEGEYSFIPEAGLLHIIRFSMQDNKCHLEVFQSEPGGSPAPMAVQRQASQNCLLK